MCGTRGEGITVILEVGEASVEVSYGYKVVAWMLLDIASKGGEAMARSVVVKLIALGWEIAREKVDRASSGTQTYM